MTIDQKEKSNRFDGRKVRDEMLHTLKVKVANLERKPILAVVWVGDDTVSARYIEQKERAAEFLGVHFDIVKLSAKTSQPMVLEKIGRLNQDPETDGIIIQLPLPESLDRRELIASLDPKKDVDGLRYCVGLKHIYHPPVINAIMKAIELSGVDYKGKKIALIGKGFLVGAPLLRYLENQSEVLVADDQTPYIGTITEDADIVISAAGVPGLIKPKMIKSGVVLIDAGTTELGGKLVGDIDPGCYEKAGFYTPVPGGIGPLTVAMIYKNLISGIK